MSGPVKSVVVVGGGTAGWLTAGIIAAQHGRDPTSGFTVTLVESPTIPIIGVGEGTWPTMRATLESLGVSETEFLRECDAAFKQGAKFVNWATNKPGEGYYHPLVLPEAYLDLNLAPAWQSSSETPFAYAVSAQAGICDQHRAPKQITTPEYAAVQNYAYHLDAGKFAGFLQRHCTRHLGVRHVLADVIGVEAAENGDIAAVTTKQAGSIAGDLFIDCTGFRALLIGEHFKVPFRSLDDILFIDTALAIQVPYDSDDAPIASHTISTGQSAGWIWDIGLWTRRGVGHVYSSRHVSEDQALQELRTYLRSTVPDVDRLEPRKIAIRSGRRETFWVNNCVAVGLSSGFLEPLESSAIVLVELYAQMIAQQMPQDRSAMEIIARRFNDKFRYRWDRVVDFLKLHYALSQRTDSAFWVENRLPETMPESLREMLELWRFQGPWHHDFDRVDEVFPSASYQYVLYGMGFETTPSAQWTSKQYREDARQAFARNADKTDQLVGALPTNRELLRRIREFGLQRI